MERGDVAGMPEIAEAEMPVENGRNGNAEMLDALAANGRFK